MACVYADEFEQTLKAEFPLSCSVWQVFQRYKRCASPLFQAV